MLFEQNQKEELINKMEKWENSLTDRTVYFDYLRVIATFAVIVLHLSAQNFCTTDVNKFEWQTFNFFNSIVRWCVPIFVMISGALFLERDVSIKKMYSKYILRMLISFGVWSFIYALFLNNDTIHRIAAIVQGHYHMWFILMITGLYMCMPFIKPIVKNDNRIKYYLGLAFVFAFLIPEIVTLADDFGNELIINGVSVFNSNATNMNMHLVVGYTGYFVLGYFLNKINITKRKRMVIYIIGLAGFLFTIIIDLIVALRTQTYCGHYYGNFNVNVLFESVAVFTWFKYKKFSNRKINLFVQKMSKYSFGAYLVHVLVIEQLDEQIGLNTLSFNPVCSVVFISIVTFIIAFTISAVLNHIPVVNKYLV